MLGKALELNGLACYLILYVPRRYRLARALVHFINYVRKCNGQLALGSIGVLWVDLRQVDFKKEKLDEGLRVAKTLQHGVHEARVAQVLEPHEAHPRLAFVFKQRVERLLHASVDRHRLHLRTQARAFHDPCQLLSGGLERERSFTLLVKTNFHLHHNGLIVAHIAVFNYLSGFERPRLDCERQFAQIRRQPIQQSLNIIEVIVAF